MMKKKLFTFILLLLPIFAHTQTLEKIAVNFINSIDTAQANAYNLFLDDDFKNKVSLNQFTSIWNQLEGAYGDYKSANYICTDTSKNNPHVFVECKFEKSNLIINSIFNDKQKIIGFYITPQANCQKTTYPIPTYVNQKKFIEKEINFNSEGLKLSGTLVLPKKIKSNTPIIIFVHGSGPNDRDESVGPNKMFKDLAYGLGSVGISSLRYDKRTYSYKDPKLSSTIQKEVVNDVLSAIKWIKNQPETKNQHIYIIGHSLGAYLAPLIAKNSIDVKGIILMAGNYRPFEDLVIDQYKHLLELGGDNSEILKKQMTILEKKSEYLKNNLTIDSPTERLPLNIPASYWMSIKNYNHKMIIDQLNIPIYILQGKRDYQVTMVDYELWKKAVSNQSNLYSTSYEKLNHLFLEGQGKPNPTEYNTQSHVPEYIINDIKNWLKKL